MQKLTCVLMLAFIVASCNNEPAKTVEPTTETTVKPEIPMAYTASYSSSFEMGKPAYAALLLKEEWKAWEDNNLDNAKNWLADTATMVFSDNTSVKGIDSITAAGKKYRGMFSAAKVTIDAVIPVYSKDKKENWVLIWATEMDTKKTGGTDTTAFMETWRINKDGKADLLLQFDRANRKH